MPNDMILDGESSEMLAAMEALAAEIHANPGAYPEGALEEVTDSILAMQGMQEGMLLSMLSDSSTQDQARADLIARAEERLKWTMSQRDSRDITEEEKIELQALIDSLLGQIEVLRTL
jgi:hypothetical protein